jgi:cyclophilin family peptidyl-prolyl cis-trans isomerase
MSVNTKIKRITPVFIIHLILLILLLSSCGSDTATKSTPDDDTGSPSTGTPAVATLDATEITISSAVLNGKITSTEEISSADTFFDLGTIPGYYVTKIPVQSTTPAGEFSTDLTGLLSYQTYYYRANVSGQETGYGTEQSFTTLPAMVIDPNKTYSATIKTNYGDIILELLPKEAPKAVNNFVLLSRQGYYKGVVFHRIVKDFMIQSGDPTGTGSGSPGYRFADEEITREYLAGTLAMANSGVNTNGSQFFITLVDCRKILQKKYTIFGIVTSGFDIVQQLGEVPVTANQYGELSKPTVEVFIEDITISEK